MVLNHREPEIAAALLSLQRASYEVEARLISFDGIPPLRERVEDVMALDLTILAVIESDVPTAMLGYLRDGDIVDIDRVAVHPDHFRRGLARTLFEALHARESDAARFNVSTGRDNEPARFLYRRMGYLETGDVVLPEGVVITQLDREP